MVERAATVCGRWRARNVASLLIVVVLAEPVSVPAEPVVVVIVAMVDLVRRRHDEDEDGEHEEPDDPEWGRTQTLDKTNPRHGCPDYARRTGADFTT